MFKLRWLHCPQDKSFFGITKCVLLFLIECGLLSLFLVFCPLLQLSLSWSGVTPAAPSLLGQLVGQPVEAFVQPSALRSTGRLHVPLWNNGRYRLKPHTHIVFRWHRRVAIQGGNRSEDLQVRWTVGRHLHMNTPLWKSGRISSLSTFSSLKNSLRYTVDRID